MKNITIEEMITKKHHDTIVVCKESKNGTSVILKANFDSSKVTPNGLNLEEMQELAKTNTSLYCEKLILTQFNDDYITDKAIGSSFILPKRFQRFYDKCISFSSESYQIYFTDLSIKYFSKLIDRLETKRVTDSLKYCSDVIESGVVRNLKLTLSDDLDFYRLSCCSFDKNNGRLSLDPKDSLYYHISADKDGKFNQQDLENMKKVLEMFAATKQNCYTARWNDTDVVGYFHGGGSVLVEGYDKYPELFHQVNSLVKRKEVK